MAEARPHGLAWRARSLRRWRWLDEPADLQRFEAAWWPPEGGAAPSPSVFSPALLQAPGIAFVVLASGGARRAGAALTARHGVVGLACTFFRGPDVEGQRRALLDVMAARFAGCPMVGYEAGDKRTALLCLGFSDAGPLRVWLRGPR